MANFNKILLVGNLTKDPQLSYLPSQTAVVEFSLAVNRTWTGKDGNEKKEVCFIDCRAFAKQAETMNKYLKKGSPILIEGRLKFDSWTVQVNDKPSKRSKHSVVIEKFQFLGSGGGQGGGQSQGYGGGASSTPAVGDSGPAVSDDDIPF